MRLTTCRRSIKLRPANKVSTARRGATLTISFDGQPLSAVPGETVAATLIAHRQLSQSSEY